MGFYEELIAGLKESIERDFDGKISRLAAKAETHTSTLSRLVTGDFLVHIHRTEGRSHPVS